MKTLIVLVVTVLIAWPGLGLAGDGETAGGAANERTTVKSSKSNSSERVGAGQGDQAGAQAGEKVKGSKSNTSERTTVKSGKSNSSD